MVTSIPRADVSPDDDEPMELSNDDPETEEEIMPPFAQVQYMLEDGSIVRIPRHPIEKAGFAIPGEVVRPDGKIIYVTDCED